MTVIDQQGHWHELGTVDVRLDEGLVIAYDTHGYIIAMVPIADLEGATS